MFLFDSKRGNGACLRSVTAAGWDFDRNGSLVWVAFCR
jgi:hypothetical protein